MSITLLQSVAKGAKLDRVVRDATALGVSRFVAVQAERCVAHYGARASAREERWRRIAVEAARQCGRGDMPVIDGVRPLSMALSDMRSELRLCLDAGATLGIDEALENWTGVEGVVLAVGPEGGWAPQERVLMLDAGFSRVTLGPFSLRTELAATTALGALLARWLRMRDL
jgi:16S rRNA (uracil1498-N3)-methyltransferase